MLIIVSFRENIEIIISKVIVCCFSGNISSY